MSTHHSRRSFLAILLGAGTMSAALPGRTVSAGHSCHTSVAGQAVEHPEPREGIDASLVQPDEAIAKMGKKTLEVFAMVREIPQVMDGIACYCGCATRPGYRSLLTCFYEDGRGFGCPICQGEARLAYRRHKEGQSLDQIRRAIDARFS